MCIRDRSRLGITKDTEIGLIVSEPGFEPYERDDGLHPNNQIKNSKKTLSYNEWLNKLGYDGGAFYSYDGSKIVWRAYYPETKKEILEYQALLSNNEIRPMALQIWTMNSDGSNQQQITNNSSANFGPRSQMGKGAIPPQESPLTFIHFA